MLHAWKNVGQVSQQEDRAGAILIIRFMYLDRHDEALGLVQF